MEIWLDFVDLRDLSLRLVESLRVRWTVEIWHAADEDRIAWMDF